MLVGTSNNSTLAAVRCFILRRLYSAGKIAAPVTFGAGLFSKFWQHAMSNETEGNTTLIRQIKDRHPDALAEYISKHQDNLAGFVRSITGEHLLALVEVDDLVQEIAATALSGLSTAPLDDYSPMQWLQQLARRRVVDAHRFHFDAKRRDANRERSMHDSGGGAGDSDAPGLHQWLAASMTSASAALSREVRMKRIHEAIETLSDDQRQAIQMRYVDGVPTKQIADQLGKTDVAVRVLLSRSMRQLEKLLGDVRPTR